MHVYVCICIFTASAGVQTLPRRKAAISGEAVSGEGLTRTHTLTPHIYICICIYIRMYMYIYFLRRRYADPALPKGDDFGRGRFG